MLKMMRTFAVAAALIAPLAPAAQAQDTAPVAVTSDVSYQFLARWDVDKLNTILTTDTPKFFGVDVTYTPATNAVNLYRITYNSVIPERGNHPIQASGLLAIPDTQAASYPMVSYQHGTVYGREEVPSFMEQSPETELMIAQFAGQGYLLIGADYFGMGISSEPEGYMVKASHQQATYDMLMASRAVLNQMKIGSDKLFLSGWSQGGFVTMAMLEKLEQSGVPVAAAATASAPQDVFALLQGFLKFPRKNDADWLNSIVILSAFAFENYYGVPGLARSVITDDYYEVSKKAYDRVPFDPKDITTDLTKLVRPEYFDPEFFAASAYGRLMQQTQAYRRVIQSPVRNYYGEADEAITIGVGRMAETYAMAMGTGNTNVEAVSTGETSHRGTYATAVPEWKIWFDSK